MSARDYLVRLRYDWLNDYLTVEKFAEHHGLTIGETRALLALAATVESHPHPEA